MHAPVPQSHSGRPCGARRSWPSPIRVKPDAPAVVRRLRGSRLEVVLLTGDQPATAGAVAREAGIDQVDAGVLPEGKVTERGHPHAALLSVSSVQEALRAVGRQLMRNHLRPCAASAIRAGGDEAETMYEELLTLMERAR